MNFSEPYPNMSTNPRNQTINQQTRIPPTHSYQPLYSQYPSSFQAPGFNSAPAQVAVSAAAHSRQTYQSVSNSVPSSAKPFYSSQVNHLHNLNGQDSIAKSAPPPPPPPPPPPVTQEPEMISKNSNVQNAANGNKIMFNLSKSHKKIAPLSQPAMFETNDDVEKGNDKNEKQSGLKKSDVIEAHSSNNESGFTSSQKQHGSSDWPESLKKYVNEAFARCANDVDKDRVEIILKGKLTRAYSEGNVWTKDWSKEAPISLNDPAKLPSFEYSPVKGGGGGIANYANGKASARKPSNFEVESNYRSRSSRRRSSSRSSSSRSLSRSPRESVKRRRSSSR